MAERKKWIGVTLIAVLIVVLILLPQVVTPYYVSLLISIFMYLALAFSWTFFSGTTGYISLAAAAFFGIGIYTMTIWGHILSIPVTIALAGLFGFIFSLIIGAATLRLKGFYFVIFTFGLSELLKQTVKWYETDVLHLTGRWVQAGPLSGQDVYYLLLPLAALVFLVHWITQTKLPFGYALRAIGQDEEAARCMGINTTKVKVIAFVISSTFMAVTGAVITLRWIYVDPFIAFNPNVSFMVVAMSMLGGVAKPYGPLFGVIPLVLISEFLGLVYPRHFMIILGAVYVAVTYFLESGITGLPALLAKKRFSSKWFSPGKEA